MTIATTHKERMELIAKLAPRYNQRANVIKFLEKYEREPVEVPTITNIYAYTDQKQYANEYYGETYRETIKYDNDWD